MSEAPEITEEEATREVSLRLGHTFRDPSLLETALTHRSYVHEHPDLSGRHNERLEFLGDAVFGSAAAILLHERFPEAREGELTRRRADLVNERALAAIGESIGLGAALRLGRGEARSGGRSKPRLLASALEACIAAVYLDGGIEPALAVARALIEPRAELAEPGQHDFKSRLQERLQARGAPTPRYEVEGTDGPEHQRTFHVAITGEDGAVLGRGSGRTKLDAEQAAARAALEASP